MTKSTKCDSRFTPFFESFLVLSLVNNQIRWAIYPPDALGNPTDFDGSRDFARMGLIL